MGRTGRIRLTQRVASDDGHQGFREWIDIGRESEEILDHWSQRKILADSDTVAVVGHMKCLAIHDGAYYTNQILFI